MKAYGVFHLFDEDGGFGDAIEQSELLDIYEIKKDAEAFITKYENPHVYETGLKCGVLKLDEINIILHKDFDLEKEPKEAWFEPEWWK